MPIPTTCLVVPCYNEANRLPAATFVEFLRRRPGMRVCFVNDGSQDATAAVLARTVRSSDGRADVIELPRNTGKGEAVRHGVRHALATGAHQFVGYWDADLATPLSEAERMLAAAHAAPHVTAVFACRLQRLGARIHRHWHRHLLGRLFAALARAAVPIPAYDTQCGAKLFRADLAAIVFAEPFLSRWCFDLELLARIAAWYGPDAACRQILELPVEQWCDMQGSKLHLHDGFRIMADLVRIGRRYRGCRPIAMPAQSTAPREISRWPIDQPTRAFAKS